jgi:hypothetical protein
MLFADDPAEMTPKQRLAEVAAILASAWLRRPHALPFTEKPLDCSAAPMPLFVNGLPGREPAPMEVSV